MNLHLWCRATREHLERGHLAATEQLLGLLAALTLRNPSAGPLALESGCLTCALQVCSCTVYSWWKGSLYKTNRQQEDS